jgi:cation diffusion facilitator CzcD-associated flavoprotein CzcO
MTSRRANSCEVAVIGAGPYGLSVAAHLDHAGFATRVFGEPMGFWRRNMPKGMMLRSPWHGTHISSPDSSHSLDVYAIAHDVDDEKLLPLENFVDYGEWFQKHAVPQLDRRAVAQIDVAADGFRLTLADGEIVTADRVVVATGLRHQDYRPQVFAGLPAALVSHACEHADLGIFRGKHVAVIGRGQSACESAALLAEAGAQTELISRGDIHWLAHLTDGNAGKPRLSWLREALAAPSAVGPFPLSWLAEFPGLALRLPKKLRDEFTRRCLKAGAAGWLKPRFANVAINAGRRIEGARAVSDRIVLDLDDGARPFDHVLLGTGYRVDIARLGILSPQLLDKIARVDGSPVLGAGFVSSVPNLHFVGSYAVRSYGPLLRFIAGAPFTAQAVASAALAGTTARGADELTQESARALGAAAANLSPPR